jgi:hypothetical protein
MTNLVELYTFNGPVYIDTRELDSGITNLKAYNCEGLWLADARVQRDKLFASRELADLDYNRVLIELSNRSRRYTDRMEVGMRPLRREGDPSFRVVH